MKNTLQVINEQVIHHPAAFIKSAEDDYRNDLLEIAERIANNEKIKIVAIAGPSASGKTTTAHILCDRLRALGETAEIISLDNFYLPTDLLPVLPNGKADIESVHSLDIELIESCFKGLIDTGVSLLPAYDFTKKERSLAAKRIDISAGGIVIVEGLHALNPLITDHLPRENFFKIYVSVNRPILDEKGKKLLSSRQLRLIRRSLRDETFRSTPINTTLVLWQGVVEGEEKYLYCYKDTADAQLKTLHLYEPGLYRGRFLGMRDEVLPSSPYYEYFLKTAAAIEKFHLLDESMIPEESLIREFIGGGSFAL